MRHLLIAIVAIFTFAGAQAAEPRANNKKVNKVIKAIKELDSKQIKVNEYDGDSIAEDIKKQLYEQFDEKKVDKVWKANKITLNTSILAESQDEEGYNNMRAFVANLNIENCENLAGIPLTMNNKNDSVVIILFSDKNNMFIFIDSLLSKQYSIAYTDDDITTKSQNMLTQLVNDKFESITEGGLIKKFTDSKGKAIAFGVPEDEEEEPKGIISISKYFDREGDSIYHDIWRPYESAIYCAFTFRDRVSVLRNKFKKSKYTYEDECPSIHYYEGTAEKGYFEMANNFGFAMLSREKQGEKTNLGDVNMECIWAADTLGMHVRQYQGMKNVTMYMVDIPEKQQCATLIVNGGLDAYKAFFNSYTLNEEDNFADKYNVTFTKATGNANKILSTKEEVNGKKSGIHLKYPILDEAYEKGVLPYYKWSE